MIPEAVRATSADAGGRPVRLVGWSVGEILALLTHAGDPELPVDAVALIGSPVDFSRVPMVAPLVRGGYHRFFRINDPAQGSLALRGRTIQLADATASLLAVAGLGDGIAPVAACHHLGGLVPNAASLELETAPGGHLGVLTGRAARGTTWSFLDKHLDR